MVVSPFVYPQTITFIIYNTRKHRGHNAVRSIVWEGLNSYRLASWMRDPIKLHSKLQDFVYCKHFFKLTLWIIYNDGCNEEILLMQLFIRIELQNYQGPANGMLSYRFSSLIVMVYLYLWQH